MFDKEHGHIDRQIFDIALHVQVVIAQNYRPPYSIIRGALDFGQRIMTFVILARLDFQGNDFIIRLQYIINFSLLLAVEVVQIPSMSVKFLRDGEYYKERYDAMAIMMVTADGAATKVYRFDPDAAVMGETVLSEIDASGKILPESAIAVNPIKTILYYSNGNKIYRLNYDGENFDSEPYITLDGNYTAKKMIFNVYDAKTLFIAAENADEQSEMKASMFIYDISDDASAKLLFKDDKVVGTVKDLIYKGNGREYESIPSEKFLSRLFR